jgi:FdhD protein
MRTPGADIDLARGMLLTEGVLNDPALILSISEIEPNHLRIDLHPDVAITPETFARHGIASAACGLCGKLTLDNLELHCPTLATGPIAAIPILQSLPQKLAAEQSLFRETGGLHAAGLADITGELLAVREDIGRHNAVDKVLGSLWGRTAFPPILVVSGRAGFELVQKAAIAGIPIFVAVGAPSSLAVDLASRVGMTLLGFTREDRFNIYTHAERVGG